MTDAGGMPRTQRTMLLTKSNSSSRRRDCASATQEVPL